MLLLLSFSAMAAESPAPAGLGPVVAGYSAHALKFGEVQVGTSGLDLGLAPRLQVGTRPMLDAVGLPNIQARFQVADGEGVDLAVHGAAMTSALAGLEVLSMSAGGTLSAAVGPVAMHVGGRYNRVAVAGLPESSPDWVRAVLGTDPVANTSAELAAMGFEPVIEAAAATVRGAAELRLVPRGGLLVQGATTVWADSAASVSAQAEGVRVDASSQVAGLVDSYATPGGTWVASVSWQQSIGPLNLRAGGGSSAVPFAWIGQAFAASLRFGGFKERRAEIVVADDDVIVEEGEETVASVAEAEAVATGPTKAVVNFKE